MDTERNSCEEEDKKKNKTVTSCTLYDDVTQVMYVRHSDGKRDGEQDCKKKVEGEKK